MSRPSGASGVPAAARHFRDRLLPLYLRCSGAVQKPADRLRPARSESEIGAWDVPPTDVHFNGGVNLPDVETVFRELADHVGDVAHAYPDGEPGDRQNWIVFQFPSLLAADGLVA